MYSSCLVCHRELGRNNVLARFGIGHRVAFSPEDGRLWAICDGCGEWNLAPIRERWEAIEECEALYESTIERGRAANVALARLDGLELVRVGTGQELPTLRYGARLRKRQRRQSMRRRLARAAKGIVLVSSAAAGVWLGGLAGFVSALLLMFLLVVIGEAAANPVVARIPVDTGEWSEITRRELNDLRLVPKDPQGWRLRIRRRHESEGFLALEAVRLVLPLFSRAGDPMRRLGLALRYIDKKGGTTESVFSAAARRRGVKRTARISKLEPHIRLALEILAGRDVEERAVSEGLEHLQTAWEHADELAEIQDELIYAPRLLERFQDLKSGGEGPRS